MDAMTVQLNNKTKIWACSARIDQPSGCTVIATLGRPILFGNPPHTETPQETIDRQERIIANLLRLLNDTCKDANYGQTKKNRT